MKVHFFLSGMEPRALVLGMRGKRSTNELHFYPQHTIKNNDWWAEVVAQQ